MSGGWDRFEMMVKTVPDFLELRSAAMCPTVVDAPPGPSEASRGIHGMIGKRASCGPGAATSRGRFGSLPDIGSSDQLRVTVRVADRCGSTEPEPQKPMSPNLPLCR